MLDGSSLGVKSVQFAENVQNVAKPEKKPVDDNLKVPSIDDQAETITDKLQAISGAGNVPLGFMFAKKEGKAGEPAVNRNRGSDKKLKLTLSRGLVLQGSLLTNAVEAASHKQEELDEMGSELDELLELDETIAEVGSEFTEGIQAIPREEVVPDVKLAVSPDDIDIDGNLLDSIGKEPEVSDPGMLGLFGIRAGKT
jgi:hypothetical protein